jgi:hypothetical protein
MAHAVAAAARQTAGPRRAESQRAAGADKPWSTTRHPGLGRLQTTVGNRSLHRLLHSGAIRAQLTIGPVDDPYEREADRVAGEVMRMPDPQAAGSMQRAPVSVQRLCAACEKKRVQRTCAACERSADEETLVQAKSGGDDRGLCPECEHTRLQRAHAEDGSAGDDAPALVHNVLHTSGVPLDATSRTYMEPRFGHDFSAVRVHTDARAAASAAAIRAHAYTSGPHIVFATGRYQPQTGTGRQLLAHELTHVVQQGASRGAIERLTAVAPSPVQLQVSAVDGGTVARAWNDCGAPEDCPPRKSGERARAASATLQVGQLDAPESGEIVSHFPIGSHRVTSLRTNPTWAAFIGVILAESSRWEILGFSDCQGGVELNTDVRTRRAQAVFNLLPAAARAKIDRAVAAPLSDCLGTNDSESNRSFNRSVVFRRTVTDVTMEGEDIEVTVPDFLCGPDVTAQVAAAVAKTRTTFAGWSTDEKEDSCDALDSLLRGGAAWDIVDLHNNAWIHRDYRPPCATAGGTPPCGSSIQVDNDCYYAGSPNYVIFGVMCKLCADYYLSIPLINTGFARFTKNAMRDLVDLYKGTGFTGLGTPSANFAESLAWAEAGYDGWPAGGSPPSGDRNNCVPKCPTPYSGRPFIVHWDPRWF